jgi:hypothetical protein
LSNTFTNTCPIIQTCLPSCPSTAVRIVSGLFIARAGATNVFGGINLANSGASHPLPSCRFYYTQTMLHPEKLHHYLSANRSKKVCYTNNLFNQFNTITSGSTFSQLVQSGIRKIRGVLIIPFISSSTYGSVNTSLITSNNTTFAQYQSPFDTAAATTAPISLINLQIKVGGVSVLQEAPYIYTFENFIEQISLYERINSADIGLKNGIFNQYFWENSRYYYVDCSRGDLADQLSTRDVTISFQNNSLQTIDIFVFTEKFDEFIIDCETGQISKD